MIMEFEKDVNSSQIIYQLDFFQRLCLDSRNTPAMEIMFSMYGQRSFLICFSCEMVVIEQDRQANIPQFFTILISRLLL